MIDPSTTTPSAAPNCLVVSFIAEPIPALLIGTELITAAVAGGIANPRPIVKTIRASAMIV